jgi:cellulose synthase/poly-beta-1,6-N-acetylglucosamine synthase-like glycosyltransferase
MMHELSNILLFLIVLQTGYAIWFLWSMGGSSQKIEGTSDLEGISIIICAKNESRNLQDRLEQILNQIHPKFEVIVVDDASEDDTKNVLEAFGDQYPNLKIIHIDTNEARVFPGKKFALSKAVAQAQYEILLLTDADCTPASEHWANLMTAPLQTNKEIVAGYGGYKKASGWLNKFIRWETMHSFIQYSSYANTGLPYMAVGRNIAYKKNKLLKAQQSVLWATMPSGDDDILIRTTATKKNMAIIADPLAFTYSEAKNTLHDWWVQKQRHVSTGKLYKKGVQFLLSLYGLSHGFMWLLFIILLCMGKASLVFETMLLRCALTWVIWAIAAQRLQEQRLILWFPICDIAWAIYNFALSPFIFFKNKQQWT